MTALNKKKILQRWRLRICHLHVMQVKLVKDAHKMATTKKKYHFFFTLLRMQMKMKFFKYIYYQQNNEWFLSKPRMRIKNVFNFFYFILKMSPKQYIVDATQWRLEIFANEFVYQSRLQ